MTKISTWCSIFYLCGRYFILRIEWHFINLSDSFNYANGYECATSSGVNVFSKELRGFNGEFCFLFGSMVIYSARYVSQITIPGAYLYAQMSACGCSASEKICVRTKEIGHCCPIYSIKRTFLNYSIATINKVIIALYIICFHILRKTLTWPCLKHLFRISLRGEAIHYRPYASSSFEVASHVKNCHFGYYNNYYYYYQGVNLYDLPVSFTDFSICTASPVGVRCNPYGFLWFLRIQFRKSLCPDTITAFL